jgi:hypothetical protein
MRCVAVAVAVLFTAVSATSAADLKSLPPNTFAEIKYTTEQPADAKDDKGQFARQGWNKLVYDADGKRVLLYDRWVDKKHGGWTIYGNCLFGFDPEAGKITPIKIDNWTKTEPKGGGYRTPALPENDTEPTPCPRHVYHAFEYVPDLKAVFICNGANQTVVDKSGKLVGHDECDGTWRLDLATNTWTRIKADGCSFLLNAATTKNSSRFESNARSAEYSAVGASVRRSTVSVFGSNAYSSRNSGAFPFCHPSRAPPPAISMRFLVGS